MRQRDAERAARRFVAKRYTYYYEQWIFNICFEHARGRSKAWSFGLTPDEEHPDYETGSRDTYTRMGSSKDSTNVDA